MSRTPTRMIPFQGAPLPRGTFADIKNNTQLIADAVGSLVGAAAAGVGFATEGESMKLREARAEFEIERAEDLFARTVAKDENDKLEFQNYLAGLDNDDAAKNLKRVAELERGKLPAMLASMTLDDRVATLTLYPAMAPENAERLGRTIGEELADAALVERLTIEGNALREAIRGVHDAADGEAEIPDVMAPIQDWIKAFNTQVTGLPDNVRNPAMTRFSGRLRSMVEEELLRGAAQDQTEAELFAENNLRLQVQRLLAGDGVDSHDPVDLREAIERMSGLTGMSLEAIEEKTGKLLRRSVLGRIDAGESAVNMQESLAGIDRRSRIWQSANTGESGELDTLVSRAIERQQVADDDDLRREFQATAIDMERTNDVDGLQSILDDDLSRIATESIRAQVLLDVTTRITVTRERMDERVRAEQAMTGQRIESMAFDLERTQDIERIQKLIDNEIPKFTDEGVRERTLLDLQTRIAVIREQQEQQERAEQAAAGHRLETMGADFERVQELDNIQDLIDTELPKITDPDVRERTMLDLTTRIKVIQNQMADEDIADQAATGRRLEVMAADLERTRKIDEIQALIDNELPEITDPDIRARTLLDLETRIEVIQEDAARFRASRFREIAADEAMSGVTDGRARGWSRETLEDIYKGELAKGRQKWEAAGRMAEHLGQVGPRVLTDIADSFTDGIANADEGLRMLHSIWQKDSALAETVLHGLSVWGKAGTKQNQGLRARSLFELAKEHKPGSPEWNRLAELAQRPGFLPGLIEADTSLDTIEGFPADEDLGLLQGRSLIQHEVGVILEGSPDLVTPAIITIYRSHYDIAYAREYSDTMARTLIGTPERLARVEVARAAARDAILGRWVGIDGLMLSTQQLALSPEMARDAAVIEYLEQSVVRFQGELNLLPELGLLGSPMTHRFFSPDNIWTYLPAGFADPEEPRIEAFMAIEPYRRTRRIIWSDDPEFRPLLRASGIKITSETVRPSGRFIWHPQYQVASVEAFAATYHGDTYVQEFYASASDAWVDEGEGPPDVDNPAFLAFLDTYARRHGWHGWMAGPTRRGVALDPFAVLETQNIIRSSEPSP